MKATGILRRIDSLGRVVVPRELRRLLHIRDGDLLEIFTDDNEQVVLKKYSHIADISGCASSYAEALHRMTGMPTLICDRERAVASSGGQLRDCLMQTLPDAYCELAERRKTSLADDFVLFGRTLYAYAPVISGSDLIGSIVLIRQPERTCPQGLQMLELTALLLGKTLE